MGFYSTDLARIPSGGFNWYIFILDGVWSNTVTNELTDNFPIFAREAGPDLLIVQGEDKREFPQKVLNVYNEALKVNNSGSQYRLPDKLPALLITNTAPSTIQANPDISVDLKVIVLPLIGEYRREGTITDLLQNIVNTLRDPEGIASLESLDKDKIKSHWEWLKALELKPNFCGFGLNLNQIIEDAIATWG